MALDPIRRFASSAAPSGSNGLRIGDAEREQAVQSLGEHLRAGRLTMVEYDDRLQQAFAARTDAELTPLFADLPGGEPRSAPTPRGHRSYRPIPVPIRAVVVLALVVGAIVWTVLMTFPPLFLIPLFWIFVGRRFGPHRRYGPRQRYDYAGPRRY